jgi:hypothetical protein
VRVADAGDGRQARRQADRRLPEDRAAVRVDARVELHLGAGAHLIDPVRLVIVLVEEKRARDPGQPGPLVRERDLLRELMLPLVHVRRQHVEL